MVWQGLVEDPHIYMMNSLKLPSSNSLQTYSNGSKPSSDGLQPNSNGQPNRNGLQHLCYEFFKASPAICGQNPENAVKLLRS